MPSKAVTTIDLSHVVFEETERATYEQRRKRAKPASREHLATIDWWLQIQPMENERCYLYRDQLIVSLGGWWTCWAPSMGFSHMQDGALGSMMNRIDEAISSKLAKDAVDAVIRNYAGCVTQEA